MTENFPVIVRDELTSPAPGVLCLSHGSAETFFFFFFSVPQLYLWGSPLLGEIFAYATAFCFFFLIQPLR